MATDELSRTFAALADPTRRAILGRLSRGQATVNDLAEPFAMSLPAVSKHLQVLERAGLIARGRDAQWRPARLVAEPLAPAADWIEGYRRFWDHSFDALEEHLGAAKHDTNHGATEQQQELHQELQQERQREQTQQQEQNQQQEGTTNE